MASTPAVTKLRERIEATTRAFASVFDHGSAQNDASIINRDVTADCTRHLLPASVPKAFDLAADSFFDTTSFQGLFANDIKVLSFKDSIMSNLVIDTEARRAAFTAKADVVIRSSVEPYSSEGAWSLYFNEDGTKVKKVIEFCEKDAILKMAGDVGAT